MATSTERTLQDTIKTAVAALTYLNANSIPARHWDDNTTARAIPCVLIHVQPQERVAPNADFYKLPVSITVVQDRNDDSGTVADLIYSDIAAYARTLTAATLSVDGVVMQPGTEEVEENLHFRTVNFDIYETIT